MNPIHRVCRSSKFGSRSLWWFTGVQGEGKKSSKFGSQSLWWFIGVQVEVEGKEGRKEKPKGSRERVMDQPKQRRQIHATQVGISGWESLKKKGRPVFRINRRQDDKQGGGGHADVRHHDGRAVRGGAARDGALDDPGSSIYTRFNGYFLKNPRKPGKNQRPGPIRKVVSKGAAGKKDRQAHIDTLSLEWFRIVPNLTAVHLEGGRADFLRGFVLALDRTRQDDFLPHLLSLELTAPWHVVGDAIIAALSSRYPEEEPNGWSRLESLRVVCSDWGLSMHWKDIGEVDWDLLVSLGNPGMDIHIGTCEENYLWEYQVE
ncbi:hypothetical protein B0H16DRAFT_1811101 [Mycena metata]|uniref:Uncharacterized protein n=1 Tax=Mycena metata TaxID=1033252 RepID=A0AAD7JBJ9_9AGAR|nr:hypothetical protein B0H16DRAFT_1811101 [Mycena metata]